ncbi:peroxidasin-like [Dysidea avara]|uniref:peroxidasin-like n=1 Tax=Dysidea avara TaxID=196820 RepID=UPI003331C07D
MKQITQNTSPPIITTQPTGGDVPIGTSTTVVCRANGLGSLVYSWERNYGGSWTAVSDGNTMSYTTDTTLTIGEYMYRCRVSNEAGSVESNATIVNVYGRPTITTHPTNQLTTDRMTVTLTCEGDGRGSIRYQWQTSSINGGPWRNISNSNSQSYTVSNLQESKQYRCIVSNEVGGITSNSAIVTVLKITTHPQDREVAQGSTVSLTCTSSVSSGVTFSWTHAGSDVTGQSTSTGNTSTLTIINAMRSDAGSYVCTVQSGSLSVMSDRRTVTVYGPPIITTQPTGGDVPIGTSTTVVCRANGLGSLVYSWERNYGGSWTAVSDGNTMSYTTDTTLTIGEYMYRCRVSNEAGSVESNATIVNVYGRPTITTHPTNQLTTDRMTVTLTCEGDGRGSIRYQWQTSSINGGPWRNISNSNSQSYTVSNLQESKQYRCIVSNEVGGITSNSAIVTVLKITTHPQDREVAQGSTVSLTCTSSVSSGVTFSWTHAGSDVTGQSTSTGNTSTLTIINAMRSDAGSYVCTVQSGSLSVMSDRRTVTVYGSVSYAINYRIDSINGNGYFKYRMGVLLEKTTLFRVLLPGNHMADINPLGIGLFNYR